MIKEKKTSEGLVAYVKRQLGKPFWFGCCGQISSNQLYTQKKQMYPEEYKWECKNNQPDTVPAVQLGVPVFDCSGLIKSYLWTDENGDICPHHEQDLSARGFFEKSPLKGDIDTIPEIEGLLVFAPHHVGIYIGNGYVIDAKGHKFGVIKTVLKDRPWTHWGYCPWIEYKHMGDMNDKQKNEPSTC